MTEPRDTGGGEGFDRSPRRAWAAAAGMALAAVLLGAVASQRLLAVAACDPRPASPPADPAAAGEALRGALRAISSDPGDARCLARAGALHLARAEALRKEGRMPEAREAWTESLGTLERALAANPLDAGSHREIALVLERLGRPGEADA